MKNFWMIFLPALLVVAGCSNSATPSDKPENVSNAEGKPSAGTLKVALLTPGPVSDNGWSAMAYEGLQAIKSELKADVANQEATGAKIKDAMRSYAQDGYKLVFGHGYEYNEIGTSLSKDFPNTVFVSSSGDKFSKNSGALRFGLEEGFYLAGFMAASMSKSGKVGMVGGPNVPSIQSTFDAFSAGAKSAKPGIEVKQVYTNENADIAKAKQATLELISQGCDFLIHQANAGASGFFDACKEKGATAFGSNANQNDQDSVIASAIIIAKPAFLTLTKEVQDGKYTGAVRQFSMKDGAIDFVINPKMATTIPADLVKALDDLKAKLKSGEVKAPMKQF